MPSSSNSSTPQEFSDTPLGEASEADFGELRNAINLDELQFKEFELKNYLGQFAVGVPCGNTILKTFTLLPPTAGLDRKLGILLKKNNFSLVPVLAAYFAELIDTIGDRPLKDLVKELKFVSKSSFIQSLAMGDILLLILNARIQSRGNTLVEMSVRCTRCSYLNKDTADNCHDLGTIAIKVPPQNGSKFLLDVTLEDGLRIGKDTVHHLYMEPLKLHQVRKLGETDQPNPEDITALIELVTEIPESEDYCNIVGPKLSAEDYDRFTLKDLRTVKRATQLLEPGIPGPALQMKMVCAACSNTWEAAPNWIDLRGFLFGSNQAA